MKKGDKVHYIPFPGATGKSIQNGIIKEVVSTKEVRVVYHCNEEWENYEDYTSALTNVDLLEKGWYEQKTRIMKLKITKEDILKANRKGSREAESENSIGFVSKHKVHRSKETYSRKNKCWKNDYA